jgi:phage/plasmid-like protein (TIGR03299 family)
VAHNIDSYIGRQSAWHELGEVTGHYMTWNEITAKGKLDFDVFKSQLHDGLGRPVDAWGMFRYNQVDKLVGNKQGAIFLGPVGADYQPIPHAVGMEMIDALVASVDGAHYETAGSLGHGETVWGLADLKLSITIGTSGDTQRGFLLFSTSHNGSRSCNFRITFTRVVCQNTLSLALGAKAKHEFTVRHTKNALARLQNAKTALLNIQADTRTIEEKMNFLAARKVTREAVDSIFARLFPVGKTADGKDVDSTRRNNTLSAILDKFEKNDGNAFPEQRGTMYSLLNAITDYTDHERSSRGNMRAESALFGSGDSLKSEAFELVYASAGSQPLMPARASYSLPSAPSSLADDSFSAMMRSMGAE